MPAQINGDVIGSPAMISCEPSQDRKVATVAAGSCAGVQLITSPPIFYISSQIVKISNLFQKTPEKILTGNNIPEII